MSEELDTLTIPMEDFFETSIAQYDEFDANAWRKGEGYICPNFPIFNKYMEGLEAGLYMFAGESNMGKALRLNTPVLKADGQWTTIGNLKVGDHVWGDDGKPTLVIAKSKIFTDHKCYKLTLDDRTEVFADADHVWRVYEYFCHKPVNREKILTTKDMLKNYKHIKPNGYARYKYRIPTQQPLKYKEKELPIHPYILGIWLGDGRSDDTEICCHTEDYEELKRLLEKAGATVGELRYDIDSNFGGNFRIWVYDNKGNNIFRNFLKECHLLGNKHIPNDYLHGSIEQRWQLLQGLMDTDGSITNGHCEFCQKEDSKIHNNFDELLSSLGLKWRTLDKEIKLNGNTYYAKRYFFACDKTKPCFALPRKYNLLRDKLRDRSGNYRTIIDIEEIPSEPMQCITVNNESHCYLVERSMVVTHNTAMAVNLLWDYCMHAANKLFGIFFSLDDSSGEVIPRIIAMNQEIPISAVSKPQRLQNKINLGDPNTGEYETWLEKRAAGIQFLKDNRNKFKIEDGERIQCGEQILDYCKKAQLFVKAHDPDANIIVCIDSLSDITFASQSFKSDKELNDYIAKQVKRWAVEILKVPIFGTLHLRKIEQNRRPTIADVKDSGRYAYEASTLFLVHNDVSRNKASAGIYTVAEGTQEKIPVIELDWAKNKKSSFKGVTYHSFFTNYSKVIECDEAIMDRFNRIRFTT